MPSTSFTNVSSDSLFNTLKEALEENVKHRLMKDFDKKVLTEFSEWKQNIEKHDAYFIYHNELIMVDFTPNIKNNMVIGTSMLFYCNNKCFTAYVEDNQRLTIEPTKQKIFEVWYEKYHNSNEETYVALFQKIHNYVDSLA